MTEKATGCPKVHKNDIDPHYVVQLFRELASDSGMLPYMEIPVGRTGRRPVLIESPRAVSRNYLVDQIIDSMREAITSGKYAAGARLPGETNLAVEFGVGRSTIREALRVLAHLGLIETYTGRGSFVVGGEVAPSTSPLSIAEIEDVYRFRFALEPDAAASAAKLRTSADIDFLGAALTKAKEALIEGDIARLVSSDTDFHCGIMRVGGFQLGYMAYVQNRDLIERAAATIIQLGRPLETGRTDLVPLHDGLFAAIEAGNAKAAETEVRRDERDLTTRLRLLKRAAQA